MNDLSNLQQSDPTAFGAVIGATTTILIVLLVLGIVWYVFSALGYYKLSKNRGINYAWIAWIPVCQNYLLGDLIGNEVWGFGYANIILVIGTIIVSVCSRFATSFTGFASVLYTIFTIVFYVYTMTAVYKLYKIYSTKPVLLIVLSVIFPFLAPIFTFAIRNNKPNFTID